MRNRTGEVGLRNVDGLWVISVGAAGNSFGITTGGILDKRFGPRIAVGLGATIFRLVTDVAQNLAPRLKKTFFMLNSIENKIILLINVKIPTIVGILTFISITNTTSERL